VRVRLTEEKRTYARAELVEVLSASPQRIQARCPHFGVCGGCHYQHLSYENQLLVKAEIVKEQLQRMGGVEAAPMRPVVPSPQAWNYRNSVQFHLTAEGKLGYQRAGSHEVVAIRECWLPVQAINDLWPQLDLEALPDLERVQVRCGAGNDLLVALESDSTDLPELDVDLPVSVAHLSPAGCLVLAGDDGIVMEMLGRPLHVSAGSFFQVNTAQAEAMLKHVLELLPGDPQGVCLDLYCGVGLFSAFLAPRFGRLIGVEMSPTACEDFAANLDEFEHVELYEGAAEQILPALDVQPVAAVVDPPRAGLAPAALAALVRMAPHRLVYVSCDPSTLGRDIKLLLKAGYVLKQVTPFDLFPQTYHIECVAVLERG
jgi:23S rRNA (uracil1939-C5)-methyltransferase